MSYCRKLTSVEEQNHELIGMGAKKEEALNQANVCCAVI